MLGYRLVTDQTSPEGLPVESIMLAEAYDINKESYVSITLDAKSKKPMFIVSPVGGINIEHVSRSNIHFHPIQHDRLDSELAAQIALSTGLCNTPQQTAQIADQLKKMYKLFMENDVLQLEINPFASTQQGKFVCFDSKITIDDNARFRRPELFANHVEQKFNFVSLDGNIGCLVNGAGLAMATMDAIKLGGGEPANFLDIGGVIDAEGLEAAIAFVCQQSAATVLLVNIFGGIIRCDMIAQGLIEASKRHPMKIPIVVRMNGTKSHEAMNLLNEFNNIFFIENDFDKAIQMAIRLGNNAKVTNNVTSRLEN